MAPTELLAEQHANNFRNWLHRLVSKWAGSPVSRKVKRGGTAGSYRQRSGADDCRYTRHFQEQVLFNGLALVIIDEQHLLACISVWRYGRKASSKASISSVDHDRHADPPNAGNDCVCDLDTSVIDELPPGRTPVTTALFLIPAVPTLLTACATPA